MRTVEFYRSPDGNCPIEEFLDSLTGKQAQKVLWVLRLIEELDAIPRQYFKKLVGSEDIWEVRGRKNIWQGDQNHERCRTLYRRTR